MAEQKTKATDADVDAFLARVAPESRRADCDALIALMKKVTKESPRLLGPTIVGFGQYHYKYASGHEGDACLLGFSPRKDAISVYFVSGFDLHADLLPRLGKYKAGKGCLYIKSMADVDRAVLLEMLTRTAKLMRESQAATPRAESTKTTQANKATKASKATKVTKKSRASR